MKKKNWKAWVALACGVAATMELFIRITLAWYVTPLTAILGLILAILARKDPATKKRKFTKVSLIVCCVVLLFYATALITRIEVFIKLGK